jgi:hypothetical protein
VFKKNLTEPTLLEMSGNPTIRPSHRRRLKGTAGLVLNRVIDEDCRTDYYSKSEGGSVQKEQ